MKTIVPISCTKTTPMNVPIRLSQKKTPAIEM
jgi:hypothetical protein